MFQAASPMELVTHVHTEEVLEEVQPEVPEERQSELSEARQSDVPSTSNTSSETAMLPAFLPQKELQTFYKTIQALGRDKLRTPVLPSNLESQLDTFLTTGPPMQELNISSEEAKTYLRDFIIRNR